MRLSLTRMAARRRHALENTWPSPARRVRFGLLAIAAAATIAASATPAVAASPQLRVIDLGTLNGDCCSQANAINDRGEVVGYSGPRRSEMHRAFLWRDGRMVDLGALGGFASEATDINNRGDTVGYSEFADGSTRATLWRDGRLIDLGTLGGNHSSAIAINDAGEIIGYSTTAPGSFEMHAFLWRRGVMTDLRLGSPSAHMFDINNRGQIVGDSAVDGMGSVPVRWQRGVPQTLTTRHGRALAINDRGQVIGYFFDSGTSFLWSNGQITDLSTLLGAFSATASDINNRGDVVGVASSGLFLWRQGKMTTLRPLATGPSAATDINNRSQVVGHSAISPDGTRSHAVLWTY